MIVFNSLFNTLFSSWNELERAIEDLPTAKEKGDAFEQLAYAYFTHFKNLYQIEKLFMGMEIPDVYRAKYKLEKRDSGVDGLFICEDGSSVACQVKFRSHQGSPSYEDLTSFWAESEHASRRCIFANCYALPKQSEKKKDQFTILRDRLTQLDDEFFVWLKEFATSGDDIEKKKKEPREYQEKMINEVMDGFAISDRGKMLAACGTGKTLVSLWIKERMNSKFTLFVAPNLALIKQTLEAWMPNASLPFNYLCVCSDNTVAEGRIVDEFESDFSYIDVPVTTEASDVSNFIGSNLEKDKIIFSTYQSLDVIMAAMAEIPEFFFDIAFFDEAHRTAGNKDSKMFTLGMNDAFIPCKKRLYMTATERFVNPRIVGKAKALEYEVFSMDNEEQYGTTFTSLPFRAAIDKGIISDYRIVVCEMKESALAKIIQENQIVNLGDVNVDAYTLFKQVILAKNMSEIGISKVISYHRDIESANQFITPSYGVPVASVVADIAEDIVVTDVYQGHINGTMNAGKRKKIFDEFIETPYGVISNARCLTEGVDVPIIDAVYFADPKNSIIDIIQAVGRSLRKDPKNPNKISYIIIPIIISNEVSKFEDVDPKEYSTLHSVIQALRDQDRILADYIDKLNLKVARGKAPITGSSDEPPIIIEISEDLDMKDFFDGLNLRIAEVNKDPSNISKEFIFTKGARKSGVTRTFRTVGDYKIDAYYHNLVLPSLKKYDSFELGLPRETLAVDHNSVSHCVKIGAIEEIDNKFYVTDIGKALFEYEDQYKSIFKEQMLKYNERDSVTRIPKFPYRMAFRVLGELGYITRFEFAYSLYIGKHFGGRGEKEAIAVVNYLRETFPNIEILNETNKRVVLEAMNSKYNTTLSFEDIWTSRTTVYNQFNYIRGHLLSWNKIFDKDSPKNEIHLLPNGKKLITEELQKSQEIETCPMDSLQRNYTQYKGY